MNVSAKGSRVVVTAAGSGIGRAIAETFHADGANVHICDIAESYLADAAAKLPGLGATHADVGVAADVDRLFDAAVAHLGGIDVLVNNAGIAGPTAPAEEVSPVDWDRVIAVNLSGMFYCARRAIPEMRKEGAGAIINISSTSGRNALPLRIAYTVSKYAVIGLTEVLAREVGPANIRVNTILPGWINNERGRRVVKLKAEALGIPLDEYVRQASQYISLRTMIEPVEIAWMALFLCSEAGRHISGQHIGVCGNVEYER
jgi:NAD(P)-dependent dehydrogenase (short-subunit alcohol dehydrogenase family)